ncbi:TIGR04211 family SH3 domain-containing protein [Thalassotalea fusca]
MSFSSIAQESPESNSTAYISDNLFIYLHAGPGTNYRIVGSIIAGTEIELTGRNDNEYTQVIDDKGREAWVESKFVSLAPGLRTSVAELNQQLAELSESNSQLSNQLNDTQEKLTSVTHQFDASQKQLAAMQSELATANAQLDNQDFEMKKQWFFNGAIVMVIGLLFGLILPKLSPKKRASMESWK